MRSLVSAAGYRFRLHRIRGIEPVLNISTGFVEIVMMIVLDLF